MKTVKIDCNTVYEIHGKTFRMVEAERRFSHFSDASTLTATFAECRAPELERIPFDLEAAKAGAAISWGTIPARWIGLSENNAPHKNIIEHHAGLAYAKDGDLFMAPKPKRTKYANLVQRLHPEWEWFDTAEEAKAKAPCYPMAVKVYAVAVPIEIDA